MAYDFMPIFGSGLDQLAAQRGQWASADYANASANFARQNQARQYWDQGVEQNNAIARQADQQALALAINERNRREEDASRRYHFDRTLEYTKARDLATDKLAREKLAATVADRAAAYDWNNKQESAATVAEKQAQAKESADAAAAAQQLNAAFLDKMAELTMKRLPNTKDLTRDDPNYARALRVVRNMPPEQLVKLDEPTKALVVKDFKLTRGIPGFQTDSKTGLLVPGTGTGTNNDNSAGVSQQDQVWFDGPKASSSSDSARSDFGMAGPMGIPLTNRSGPSYFAPETSTSTMPAPRAAVGQTQVSSKQQLDSLRPGTPFVWVYPDGRTRSGVKK